MSTGTICLNCRAWLGACRCGNTVPSDDGKTSNLDRFESALAPTRPRNLFVAQHVRYALYSGEFHRTLAEREARP